MGKPCTAKTTGYHGCILAGERGGGYENVADKATINTCNLNISRSVLIGGFSTCTNYPSIVHVLHLKFVPHYKMPLATSVWTVIIVLSLPSECNQHECSHCRAEISALRWWKLRPTPQYHHLCIANNLQSPLAKAVVYTTCDTNSAVPQCLNLQLLLVDGYI